ncbi:aspartate aminotransferase family protein [Motiliproteus sp. SC1-56]|uniref:aspartate aminotransferase family protein n=1 Tax=Motiliproteus sp. SC1-56 TaxID=2799565 RepID=UPI001A9034F5|nr:aspartate aminotransferase family protein [Motiliproteus sp. SC1-56]
MASQPLMNTYARLSVAFERGEGAWLYDEKGNKFLDALSGLAVCGLGHAHPAVTRAISDQAAKLIHTSNLYTIPLQQQLADRLTQIADMDTAFFCNSGAEANEAAIKLARLYGHSRGVENPAIVVMGQSFHGRTLATLSATGNRKAQAGFEPLVSGFVRAPFNDVEAVKTIAGNNPNVVAVLVEPIQGEAGVRVPDDDYLERLRLLCDQNGWLLMLDEVQTGNGRTGSYFAYQQSGILPDVVTTAKGLGNGVPIGACLARGKAAHLLKPGHHGSTFGGNPLACAAALAVIDTLEKDNLMGRAAELGARMLDDFRTELDGADYIRDIRGKGMMLAIEMNQPCTELGVLAKVKGILLNVTGDGKVIRLLPPLTLSDTEASLIVGVVSKLIKIFAADESDGASA